MGPEERKTNLTSTGVQVNGLIPGTNYTFAVVSMAAGKNRTMYSTAVQLEKSTSTYHFGPWEVGGMGIGERDGQNPCQMSEGTLMGGNNAK